MSAVCLACLAATAARGDFRVEVITGATSPITQGTVCDHSPLGIVAVVVA